MKIDFHVHTKYSIDSLIEPRDLARRSKLLNLIPSVSDHNTIDCHPIMRSLKARFIPSEEISTDHGDLIGLYMNEAVPKKTPFMEALDSIKEQGAIAYLPHMFDRSRKGHVPEKDAIKKIDIIEVFNARCALDSYNMKAERFAQENKKLKAAGSDSHFLFEFGRTYTELPEFDLENPKALLKALKSAKLTTKKTAFIVRGTTTFIALGRKLIRKLNF